MGSLLFSTESFPLMAPSQADTTSPFCLSLTSSSGSKAPHIPTFNTFSYSAFTNSVGTLHYSPLTNSISTFLYGAFHNTISTFLYVLTNTLNTFLYTAFSVAIFTRSARIPSSWDWCCPGAGAFQVSHLPATETWAHNVIRSRQGDLVPLRNWLAWVYHVNPGHLWKHKISWRGSPLLSWCVSVSSCLPPLHHFPLHISLHLLQLLFIVTVRCQVVCLIPGHYSQSKLRPVHNFD